MPLIRIFPCLKTVLMRSSTFVVLVLTMTAAVLPADDDSELKKYVKLLPFVDSTDIHDRFSCWDICHVTDSIIQYYRDNEKNDSLDRFIRFLSDNCGHHLYIPNSYILHQIKEGVFNEDSLPCTFFFDEVREYERNHMRKRICGSADYYNYITDSLFSVLDTNSIEYLIVTLYRGDRATFFRRLRNDSLFSNTRLKRLYDQELYFIRRSTGVKSSGYATLAVTKDRSSTNGALPEIGWLIGKRFARFYGDAYIGIAFNGSDKNMYVDWHDSLYHVHSTPDLNLGLDIGYELLLKNSYHIDLLLGYLWNMKIWSIAPEKDSTASIMKISGSPCPGIGYRWYVFEKRIMINPQLRFWMVDFKDVFNGEKNIHYYAAGLKIIVGLSDRIREDVMLEALGD